jgi:ABC-2 type transport system ATP-binding protein
VLHDVSFSLAPGEIVAYLGPNGSGKTTTVKVLAGLVEPSAGRVLIDGADISDDPLAYRRRLGYVPEAAEVYPFLTGREYLLLAGRLRSLAEPGLTHKVDVLLELFSLWACRHEPLSSYSKGMKQRVLLCAALLHNPDLLLLDEPLNGLDATSVLVVKRLLERLAADGRTILYSTHLLDIAERLCSRVVMLHRGRVVADDSVAGLCQLMERPSLEEVFAELARQEPLDDTVEAILDVVTAAG